MHHHGQHNSTTHTRHTNAPRLTVRYSEPLLRVAPNSAGSADRNAAGVSSPILLVVLRWRVGRR